MQMRKWGWFAAVLIGCSGGEPTTPPDPSPSPDAPKTADPAPAHDATLAEAKLLEEAPPPTVSTKVLEKVAAHYGVGLVRCPLAAMGTAYQIYGTERDMLRIMGPTWEMEWDPADAAPWDPVFDGVTIEDNWVAMLSVPGTTRAWAATRTKVYTYEFPPVVAGEISTCTSVSTSTDRAVRGKVKIEGAKKAPPQTYVAPCLVESARVADDQTFVAEVPTPCTIWVEGGPYRSEKVRIDPGEGHVDVELTMKRDPLLEDNRLWSAAGFDRVEEILGRVETRLGKTEALLDSINLAFPDDKDVQALLRRWRYEQSVYTRKISNTRLGLQQQKENVQIKPN